jgi:sRNA-binding protein
MSVRPRAPTARSLAIIERFALLFPNCFAVYERKRRPLKIGIDKDLIEICRPAIAKGIITIADIKGTLRVYTGADGYLRNMRAGVGRVDLAGRIVTTLTEDEAQRAKQILDQRRAERRAAKRQSLTAQKETPRAAGAVIGVKASIERHERSTPSGAGASPAE